MEDRDTWRAEGELSEQQHWRLGTPRIELMNQTQVGQPEEDPGRLGMGVPVGPRKLGRCSHACGLRAVHPSLACACYILARSPQGSAWTAWP